MSKTDYGWMRTLGQLSSLPFLILISTLLGMGFGNWLDGKFHTEPLLAFIFTLLGLASGIYESAKMLMKVIRDNDKL